MKTQKTGSKSRFTLRARRKKSGLVRGKLRIRSMPGAFLVLGAVVVMVGSALAMAGYWPYRLSKSKSSVFKATEGENLSDSQQKSRWGVGTKGLLSTASLVHSERMKLLGPVIMGVGLFILICANTVLYENRDRETQMLVAQMQSVLCSVSTAVPSADLKQIALSNSLANHFPWIGAIPPPRLNALCLQKLTASEPLFQSVHPEREISPQSVDPLVGVQLGRDNQKDSEPPLSFSNPWFSHQTDLKQQLCSGPGEHTTCSYQFAPLVELNSCLVSSSSLSTLEVNVPVVQPRRCHSVNHRTRQCVDQTVVCVGETLVRPGEGDERQSRAAGRDGVAPPGGTKKKVEKASVAADEETRRSWPQLDLATERRYMRLENKEDSVDKLLDQMEQQCSQWNDSFGSGPFQ